MTENVSLQAKTRSSRGKMQAKKQRKEGVVPGIYYDREGTNIPLNLGYGAIQAAQERAHNQVIYLQIQNEDGTESSKPALIWDIQFHPVKGLIQHVDFVGVDMKREVKMDIPVEFVGEPVGVDNGGVVNAYRDSVPVSCLPGNIPEKFEIDISELDIGDALYFSQVSMPKGVARETEEDLLVVGVSRPQQPESEEEEEPVESGESEGSEEPES
ncbi:MAG: 50S ribosomal protein L25 [Desulfohalobiaceae bacterium]|nr:50S ribosomal protein L25 [Desulfohalobiaceae bacterium]